MRMTKSPCRGLNCTLCLLMIAVLSSIIILLIGASKSRIFKIMMPSSKDSPRITVNYKSHDHQINPKPLKGKGYPPVLAYWICGTKGESKKMVRLLKAIYHPRNQYILQLDDASSHSERLELAQTIQSHDEVFEAFGNVNVIGKSYGINRMGSSALSAILHAAALLLKLNADWDWFITLSASDYPLMTQDDILHAFTFLPKDLNFIHFTNKTIVRKQQQDMNQIVVDPSLFYETSNPLYFAVESRETPDAFNIFGGSPWVILTRALMEYTVSGWDNLPRKLLMFFTNVPYPLESYFHTLLCNSIPFKNTSFDIFNTLVFSLWDTDPSESQTLDLSHYHTLIQSGAAFARPFDADDLILDKIDDLILHRSSPNALVSGFWCSQKLVLLPHNTSSNNGNDNNDDYFSSSLSCSNNNVSGGGNSKTNIDVVKPGPYGIKLQALLSDIVKTRRHKGGGSQCQKP